MYQKKLKVLSEDIEGYISNILCEENDSIVSTIEDLREEMIAICEYMKAICSIISNEKIDSDYLGVSEIINNIKD